MTRKTPLKTNRTSKAGRPQAGSSQEDARESLMKAAIPLFAKKGYSGTSVKDIADKAGVNVSLVSYHFDGKEGLYRTCIENFGKNRLAAVERILQPASTREEFRVRLEMLIDDLMIWFDEEPDICSIVQREAQMGFEITRDVFEQTFLKIFTTFLKFVEAGQKKRYLRTDIDTEIASRFFFIGLTHITQKDDRSKKLLGISLEDPSYRKKLKNQLSVLFFEGMQAKDKVTK
jgi:AcrR family transcriptional regulator